MAHNHNHQGHTHDFLKKEPTKNEKMFYELAMRQEMLDRNLWTTSAYVTALGILLNVDPEKIAELLASDNEKVKEYSKKINEAIDRIEAAKATKKDGAETASTEQAPQ